MAVQIISPPDDSGMGLVCGADGKPIRYRRSTGNKLQDKRTYKRLLRAGIAPHIAAACIMGDSDRPTSTPADLMRSLTKANVMLAWANEIAMTYARALPTHGQVAKLLAKNPGEITHLIDAGHLVAFKVDGGLRIDMQSLMAHQAKRGGVLDCENLDKPSCATSPPRKKSAKKSAKRTSRKSP